MPSSSELPPWLRRTGAAAPRGGKKGRAASAAAFGLMLVAAGAGAGFLYGRRDQAVAAPPPPPAPVCPPAVVCPSPGGGSGPAHARVTSAGKRSKPAPPAALSPLPERSPLDDGARTQALRAFAEKKAPELRECIAEPDRGPPLKLGAAFEIGSDGAVDFVQILGADGSPKDVRRCYANRLKHWRFPEELLRGDEKLLVNFVL